MKTCHALQQVNGPVRLWVPKSVPVDWVELSEFYGLTHPFDVVGLNVIPLLRRYDLTIRSILQARKWGAEIIYTWNLQAAVFALYKGMPVILEMHALPSGKFGPWLFKKFLNLGGKKRLLVITDALRSMLENEYHTNLRGKWVQVAPNGVDLERYQNLPDAPSARKILNLPEQITAAYTGHFYSGRGLQILLQLAKLFPQVQFLWVGGNPEDVSRWQEKLKQDGLNNVILTGFVVQDRLPLYQSAAEILLMPYESAIAGSSGGNSAEYCSPMKMFDYMAAHRVILTSDLPVIREVLNSTNAVICPAEDAEAWGNALQNIINNPAYGDRLAAQAKSDVLKFSWLERAEKALQDF
jgi:glycosyltransferase involved in cell wall biosynthesis